MSMLIFPAVLLVVLIIFAITQHRHNRAHLRFIRQHPEVANRERAEAAHAAQDELWGSFDFLDQHITNTGGTDISDPNEVRIS